MSKSILEVKIHDEKSYKKHHVDIDGSLDEKQEKALAILLGAYNQFGRSVDLEEFATIRNKFKSSIDELAAKL